MTWHDVMWRDVTWHDVIITIGVMTFLSLILPTMNPLSLTILQQSSVFPFRPCLSSAGWWSLESYMVLTASNAAKILYLHTYIQLTAQQQRRWRLTIHTVLCVEWTCFPLPPRRILLLWGLRGPGILWRSKLPKQNVGTGAAVRYSAETDAHLPTEHCDQPLWEDQEDI